MFDRLNPIFVYEIRQAVRSRLLPAAVCLFPVLLTGLCGFLLLDTISRGRFDDSSYLPGTQLARVVLMVLFHANLFVLVPFALNAIHGLNGEDELARTTPLSSSRIALGIFQALGLTGVILCTMALPYLTLAWLYRGVDLVNVLVLLIVLSVIPPAMAVFLAAIFYCQKKTYDLIESAGGLIFALPLLGMAYFIQMALIITVEAPTSVFVPACFWVVVSSQLIFLLSIVFLFKLLPGEIERMGRFWIIAGVSTLFTIFYIALWAIGFPLIFFISTYA